MPLAYTRELVGYWANDYDWRSREAALNRFDQFITEIDGLDIHFIHQRSPHADAFPLVITHGWPGSIVEFHKVIEPLTNPRVGTRRGRLPRRVPVAAGLRLLRKAHRHRVGRGKDRRGVGNADAAPWLRPLRRPGRRLGRRGHHPDRSQSRPLRGDPPEHADRQTYQGRADESDRGGAASVGRVGQPPQVGHRAIPSSSPPGRRHWATGWSIRRWDSWRGSSRSSGRGRTATGIPRTCSAATSCSTT